MSKSNVKQFIDECLDIESDEAFYVFNVEDVIHRHELWRQLLPRIIPYYAMKANPYPLLLEILYGLGVRYDCASQHEIDTILGMGAQSSDIVFANPCKPLSAIKYAKQSGVDLMTFDSEEELIKIHTTFPESKVLLRIKVDDKESSIRLSEKFGAHLHEVEGLLRRAKALKLTVIGIAFHVGSGCQTSISYAKAIRDSRIAFDMGLGMGFKMSMLDCGGGFPGSDVCYNKLFGEKVDTFEQIASVINDSLDVYYPESHVTVIGEPGRYYCESAFTLVTKVISKKCVTIGGNKTLMYYLNDGIYGSFLDVFIINKNYKPLPLLMNAPDADVRQSYPSILWGPTCDSADCINGEHVMPELNVDEWIMFEDMGCYSLPFAPYGFNGIPAPTYKIYVSEFAETYLKGLKNWPRINSKLADVKYCQIYSESIWYKLG